MSLIINQPDMLRQLDFILPVTKTRSPLPILKNAALTASPDNSEIYATNLRIFIKSKFTPDSLLSPLSVTLSAEKLSEILRNLRSDVPVEMEMLPNQRIRLSQGDSTSFTLNTLSIDDFPAVPSAFAASDVITINIPRLDLLTALESTVFSASDSDFRFNLNAVFITSDAGKLTFVTTDGHRLSLHQLNYELTLPEGTSGYLLDKDSAVCLTRWLSRFKDDNLDITLHKKELSLESAEFFVSFRLLDGDFPDYKKVIPPEFVTPVRVDKQDMLSATRRVGLMTSERNSGMNVSFDGSVNSLSLSVTNPELGEATDQIDIEAGSSKPFALIVNKDYLIDCLNSIDSHDVYIFISEQQGKPVIFRSKPDDINLRLIMPMRA